MRLILSPALATVIFILTPSLTIAQDQQEGASRVVQGGGISVPGWTGDVDANEEKAGKA